MNRVMLEDSDEVNRLTLGAQPAAPLRRPDIVPEERELREIKVDARFIMCVAYTSKFVNQMNKGYDNAYTLCRALGFSPRECVDARTLVKYQKNR
jgi:hypothetical protein